MTINITIKKNKIETLALWAQSLNWQKICFFIAVIASAAATWFFYHDRTIVAYGDAESHLNIAKRVVHNLTPGLAQLGGIWLPLPHVLMIPFVSIDFLWRTGLAGSIVSGVAFVVSAVFIFKTIKLLTGNVFAAVVGYFVFISNPNILYLQATPMSELTLIVFFILSSYYFIEYIKDKNAILPLIKAAFFGFLASLSRYDGWFLVGIEAMLVVLLNLPYIKIINEIQAWKLNNIYPLFKKAEGITILYITLAFAGIVLWLVWDWLILGDPFYFTSSQFSAKSQQNGWLAKNQLPAYHDIFTSVSYYTVTSMATAGILVFWTSAVGLVTFLLNKAEKNRFWITTILLVPFAFYIITLFIGQSLIFIPHLTPITFEWTLFNVRYGVMMIPVTAILFGLLFSHSKLVGKYALIGILFLQFGLYQIGYSRILAYDDGTIGLSSNQHPDAEAWLAENYDHGLVVMDDYKRIFSLIGTGIPMQNVIYIGNQDYWDRALRNPEQIVRWIIIQKGDTMWTTFYDTAEKQKRLYTYFQKMYESPDILVFRISSEVTPTEL